MNLCAVRNFAVLGQQRNSETERNSRLSVHINNGKSKKSCSPVYCSVRQSPEQIELKVSRRDICSTVAVGLAALSAPAARAVELVDYDADEEEGGGGVLAKFACDYQTSATGLKYCDLKQGDGEAPVAGTTIRAHYTGRLVSNGVVFDSSYDRGSPLQFPVGVGKVIKGWDEGIIGGEGIPPMQPGGKRRLLIPSALGYGARGAGRGVIPPNADLLFDVELVKPSKFK